MLGTRRIRVERVNENKGAPTVGEGRDAKASQSGTNAAQPEPPVWRVLIAAALLIVVALLSAFATVAAQHWPLTPEQWKGLLIQFVAFGVLIAAFSGVVALAAKLWRSLPRRVRWLLGIAFGGMAAVFVITHPRLPTTPIAWRDLVLEDVQFGSVAWTFLAGYSAYRLKRRGLWLVALVSFAVFSASVWVTLAITTPTSLPVSLLVWSWLQLFSLLLVAVMSAIWALRTNELFDRAGAGVLVLGVAVLISSVLGLFANLYQGLSASDPNAFSNPVVINNLIASSGRLSAWDSTYLSVTTFTTVGSGNLVPVSEFARILVASQSMIDFLIAACVVALVISRMK